MAERREIDERDIDRLLAALTDVQIAALFGMTNAEVYQMRQSRLSQSPGFPSRGSQSPESQPKESQSADSKSPGSKDPLQCKGKDRPPAAGGSSTKP